MGAAIQAAHAYAGPQSQLTDAGRIEATALDIERPSLDRWDQSVAGFDGISPEQTCTFARLRWPSVKHEPLVFHDGGETVGGALVMVQRLPFGVGSVAISKWAPFVKDAGRPDRMALYARMVETLIGEYAQRRGMMLTVLPRAQPAVGSAEHDYLSGRGFVAGTNVPFPDRYVVDLNVPDAEHRGRLASKWRYHLGHAERAKLDFEVADADRLPAFAALYESMTDRKRFPDHSAYDTVPALMAASAPALRPQLFFVRKDDAIVSGALIFTAGDTAIYLYGATNEQALPLRAGYFMHWEIMRWLKQHSRARWYDLGGSDGFQGLHQFKKGMVGTSGAILPLAPMLNYGSKTSMLLGTGAFALRDLVINLKQRISSTRSELARPDLNRPPSE